MNSCHLPVNLSRGLSLAVLLTSSVVSVHAGDIVGQIVDANNGGYLPGSTITLVGTQRSETSDREGRFRFKDVDAGTATIQVEFLGYESKQQSVEVPESGDAAMSIAMGDGSVELAEYVIEGMREGRTKALQQKRTATNVMDIISADSAGELPDRNVADALARVPGLNVDVEGGEGRWVTVRGIEPSLNNVTLNGATMATPDVDGRGGRAMPLDVVGTSQVSQIEVIKSVTPDMDGHALGGTINIKTGSAFDREARVFFGSVEAGWNDPTGKSIYGAEATFADRLGASKKVGLSASLHYSQRPYKNDEVQADFNDINGQLYMEAVEIHPREGTRDRLGLNLDLEFRPQDDVELYFRTILNQTTEEESQQQLVIGARRDPVFVTPTSVTFNRMRYDVRGYEEETEQQLMNLSAGGSVKRGNLTIKGELTYSSADETNPVSRSAQFRTGNVNTTAPLFALDWTNFLPVFDENLVSTNTSLYPVRRFLDESRDIEENTWTPRVDLRWDNDDMIGGRKGYIQTGVKYTDRNRFVDRESSRPVSSATLATVGAAGPEMSLYDSRYRMPFTIDTDAAFDFYAANPGLFTTNAFEEAENEVQDDYDTTEQIYGLYAMLQLDWTDRLSMIVGARYEATDASITGYELRTDSDGNLIGVFEETSDFDYTNVLPNLQFTYRASERSVWRFAVTGTLGRPRYEDAAPQSFLEYDLVEEPLDPAFLYGGSLERGNPDLEPYQAVNFDLSYEYYLKSGGLLSISGFYKDIENPIYTYRSLRENEIYNGLAFEQLDITTRLNAESGSITGLEVNAQIPFSSFIKGFLEGFGIDANASFISSETELFDDPDNPRELSIPFFRQPDLIYNLGAYYQKGKISARVAYNYQSGSIREIGDTADYDIYRKARSQLDLQASYKLNENYKLFVNWQNITDEPTEESFGDDSIRMRRSELFGWNVRGGVRFHF